MAHPFNAHRAHHVERNRVTHIAHGGVPHDGHMHQDRKKHIVGYKAGGAVHGDEAEDKKLIKKMIDEKMGGKAKKHRMDRKSGGKVDAHGNSGADKYIMGVGKKLGASPNQHHVSAGVGKHIDQAYKRTNAEGRARGGRTKHKGKAVHINIMTGHDQPQPVPVPVPAPHPPMAAGPAPAPMPPPGMAPGAPGAAPMAGLRPPMVPPGGPMIRKAGGRAYKTGGAVKSTKAWDGMMKAKTPMQHSGNKNDGHNIGRPKAITYKTGGRIEGGDIARQSPIPTQGKMFSGDWSKGPKAKKDGPIYSGNLPGGLKPKQGMAPKLDGGAGGGRARLEKPKRILLG